MMRNLYKVQVSTVESPINSEEFILASGVGAIVDTLSVQENEIRHIEIDYRGDFDTFPGIL